MRLYEIVGLIKENLYLGIAGLLVIGVLLGVGYFGVYKKLLKGKKRITKKQMFLGGLFTIYIIMVIGATLLNRGSYFKGETNLHFLSSYREAWNSATLRSWQFLILNILMFFPLGILLPLVNKRFQDIKWIFLIALIFTLFIECFQFMTGFGIFELDDIFNNILGALIGYGIVMSILTMAKGKNGKKLKALYYLFPLFIVVLVFGGMHIVYERQEFGNLEMNYDYKRDMKNTEILSNIELNNNQKNAAIFKAPSQDATSAKEFAINFLENLNLETKDLEINAYHDEAIYWAGEERSCNISINYLDGSYTYTDFSSFDGGMEGMDVDKSIILKDLKKFNINIPEGAAFRKEGTGFYKWMVDKKFIDDKLTDGTLSCVYYKDNTIKEINNNLIRYDKVGEARIKSELEAYKEIKEGKFKFFKNDIKTLKIMGVKLDYDLDSKGYYQPIYVFKFLVDGKSSEICIPALL